MQSAFGAALASTEGQYSRASPKERTDATGAEPRPDAPAPTVENLQVLVDPILKVLRTISCYEVMGNSTQVIVVDYDAPLTIAFIAAQESRVTSCSLWDAKQRKFVGVMTISDYIRVLLHCSAHPEEVEKIKELTVRQWRELPESRYKGPNNQGGSMISALAEEPLGDCIHRMIANRVNRLPIFAPMVGVTHSETDGSPIFPPGSSPSIVSLLTYVQVLSYLSRAIFGADGSVSADGGAVLNSTSGLAFSPATQAVLGATPPTNVPSAHALGLPYNSIFDVPVGLLGFPSIAPEYRPRTMTMENRVVDALTCFIEDSVHALPIVDDRKIVIDIIARNDVMRLETGGMYDISKTLADALSFRVGTKVTVFTRADTLREVTMHFINSGASVMFCVDDKDAVVGQLALVDIVKCFFSVAHGSNGGGGEMEADT